MLMRFDPFREVDRFAEQVDQMFRRSGSSIPMDAVRHGNQVFVSFDLPGVDPGAPSPRRVLLGQSLDTGRLEAAYDHGVLTVTIPVAEQAQPRKVSIGGAHPPTALDSA